MTIVVDADENTLEQVRKQLAKLVPVTNVKDFKDSAYIERDLALVCVGAGPASRHEVIEVVNLFRGRVVDVGKESLMVELSGTEEKIERFVDLMKPYGIRELARTGVIAMAREIQPAGGAPNRLRRQVETQAQSRRPRGRGVAAKLAFGLYDEFKGVRTSHVLAENSSRPDRPPHRNSPRRRIMGE